MKSTFGTNPPYSLSDTAGLDTRFPFRIVLSPQKRPDGEIGRHARFRV